MERRFSGIRNPQANGKGKTIESSRRGHAIILHAPTHLHCSIQGVGLGVKGETIDTSESR
tara:strand:+ start:175 stop:354 length:180 start_codon:yes stop_codon:yes gene_type:complete